MASYNAQFQSQVSQKEEEELTPQKKVHRKEVDWSWVKT